MSLRCGFLISSDNKNVALDVHLLKGSETLQYRGRKQRPEKGIRLPITSDILDRVTAYCKKHFKEYKSDKSVVDEYLRNWDAEFMNVEPAVLVDLILAAKYLDIRSLLDLTCQTVANMNTQRFPRHKLDTGGGGGGGSSSGSRGQN